MKKLYLLPLSMLLVTTGYADEPQQTESENIAQEEIVQNPDAEKNVARQASSSRSSTPTPKDSKQSSKPSDTHGNQAPKKENAPKSSPRGQANK